MTTAHNPRAEMPEDAPVIAPADGQEHGYWGQAPDVEDDHRYTVAGVTADKDGNGGGTAKAPRSAPSNRAHGKENDK